MATKLESGKILTGETREIWKSALKKRYEDGASIRELQEWSGRSYGGVHDLLLEAGVTLRARGGHAGRNKGGSPTHKSRKRPTK